jgi:acyl-coenzyme A synthetase/AMP-(fatty) acid ligase
VLLDRVLAPVEQQPDAPAFVVSGQVITYRHFRALLASAVAHLRSHGVKAGDVVGIETSQTPLYLVVLLALGWIGALAVPVALSLRPRDRDEVLRKFRVGALICEGASPLPAGCRMVRLEGLGARGDETMERAGTPAAPSSPFRIALTSGTTAVPRGVLHTLASFEQRLDRMRFDAAARPVVIPPALHITLAVNLALHALVRGGTVVFPRGYDNESYFAAIRTNGVTHVALPPANLGVMLRALPHRGPAFPGVRQLRALGTLTAALVAAAQRQFSPNVFVPYGITEVGVVSMATPEMLREDPSTVGPLEPGVEARFTQDGEIAVRVPGMPADYHGPDAGRGTRFRDGFFWPGDRARLANGRLYIDGRLDDIINAGGRKVAPEFVESVLLHFAGVREAGAFPLADGAGGIQVAAAIVAEPTLDREGLRHHALQRLGLAAPARYVEVAALPRNAMGKLERDRLPALAGESASLPGAGRD